jgi:hypothetical protein
LRNVITPEECAYLVAQMSAGNDLEQVTYREDYRRNDRCIFNSPELAEVLWHRVRPTAEALAVRVDEDPAKQRLLSAHAEQGDCPCELRVGFRKEGVWRPVGLNECLRFCRYQPGGFFRAHCDATFVRSESEMSLFTCMFYLDSGMQGGATRFLKTDLELTLENHLQPASEGDILASVTPEPGLCLLFFQPGLLHEGEEVLRGAKHILRTDVMFRRDAGSAPARSAQEEEAWRLAQEAAALESSAQGPADYARACQLYRRAFKLDPKIERAF